MWKILGSTTGSFLSWLLSRDAVIKDYGQHFRGEVYMWPNSNELCARDICSTFRPLIIWLLSTDMTKKMNLFRHSIKYKVKLNEKKMGGEGKNEKS